MNRLLISNILRFIILIPIQVLVLDNINLGGSVNPYLYTLFIIMLPFEVSGYILLLSSFMLGLSVDIFSGTPGMHAAASTFAAFIRPAVIRFVGMGKDIDPGSQPSVFDQGFTLFFFYALILVFFHHMFLFFIEVFRISGILSIIQRTLLSTIFTMGLIIIVQYLFSSQRKK
jgi:hypothetical protein